MVTRKIRFEIKTIKGLFFGSWQFCISFLQRVLPTDNYEENVRIRFDKILTTSQVARNNGSTARQESAPQSASELPLEIKY
jgi:hypothetical protein